MAKVLHKYLLLQVDLNLKCLIIYHSYLLKYQSNYTNLNDKNILICNFKLKVVVVIQIRNFKTFRIKVKKKNYKNVKLTLNLK